MLIFTEQRSESAATVRLRFPMPLTGTIRGPRCKYARTLPSNAPIQADQSALVVDPCYWTPELPFLYDVHFESSVGIEDVQWGLRRLEALRGSLFLNGKRKVLRVVGGPTPDLASLHAMDTAWMLEGVDVDLLARASELGVLCLVRVDGNPTHDDLELQGLPAAHIVVSSSYDAVPWPLPTDMLFGVDYDSRLGPCEAADLHLVWDHDLETAVRDVRTPIIVRRQQDLGDCYQLRQACDRLQRDMAEYGQFAGYLCEAP